MICISLDLTLDRLNMRIEDWTHAALTLLKYVHSYIHINQLQYMRRTLA